MSTANSNPGGGLLLRHSPTRSARADCASPAKAEEANRVLGQSIATHTVRIIAQDNTQETLSGADPPAHGQSA